MKEIGAFLGHKRSKDSRYGSKCLPENAVFPLSKVTVKSRENIAPASSKFPGIFLSEAVVYEKSSSPWGGLAESARKKRHAHNRRA